MLALIASIFGLSAPYSGEDTTPGGSLNVYVRADGTYIFRQPDGSNYIRP